MSSGKISFIVGTRYLIDIVVNPMILLKIVGALSFPAEHDEDFSVQYKKWCPSCRAIYQNVTPRKTLLSRRDA
jgi:hypothetical protein